MLLSLPRRIVLGSGWDSEDVGAAIRPVSPLDVAAAACTNRDALSLAQAVVFLRPVEIHGPLAHGLECAFHAYRADVDVPQHGRDKQHGDDAVGDLGELHVVDVGAVEREHQNVATHRNSRSAQDDDPVDHLLTAVEAIGWRVIIPDDSAPAFEPLDVDPVRNVAGDPHEEDQDDAEREREAEVVVRVFGPLRPGSECLGTHEWKQQRPAEGDVETGNRKNDETCRRHPVHEALDGVEAHDRAAGASALDAHHAAPQIEGHEDGKNAEDRDATDPA
jgi:hypothetical protein